MKIRALAFGTAVLLLAARGGAEDRIRKNFLTLSGGVQYQLSSGQTDEYVLGENDFPVVPAHLGAHFGLSYLRMAGSIGWELDVRYMGATAVDLEDPSDGDIVTVNAGPRASLTLQVLFAPFSGALRPYVLAGGGADLSLAGDATYTSRFGYVIEVPAPAFKDRIDPEAHVGIGLLIGFGKSWGARLESRFGWIFEGDRTLSGISGAGGFTLFF